MTVLTTEGRILWQPTKRAVAAHRVELERAIARRAHGRVFRPRGCGVSEALKLPSGAAAALAEAMAALVPVIETERLRLRAPKPEIGWVLTPCAEGHGYATEAARAVHPLALAQFGSGRVVSYIDAANTQSARTALALGARRDPVAEAALGEPDLLIYRHFAAEDRT